MWGYVFALASPQRCPTAPLPSADLHEFKAFFLVTFHVIMLSCAGILPAPAGPSSRHPPGSTMPDVRFFPVPADRQPRHLSSAQIAQFNQAGYLVGLPAFSPAETARNRADFDRMLAQAAAVGADPYNLTNYERHSATIYDLVVHPRVLDLVEDILGPDIVCWGTHCFAKPAGDPKQVSWHQDATYWTLTPTKTVTAWLAIDDVDPGNGVMRVIPGSHLAGPLPIRQSRSDENNALWLTVDGVERMAPPVAMTQPAGALSLHSDLLLHDSPANPSDRRRCGLAVRYCTPEVRLANGDGRTAVLCRGSDPSGYWKPVPRPAATDITVAQVPVERKVARPLSDFPVVVR
jgi:non-heme Fe2+,alpha-ketoglutarate-dependent halogenase